MIRDDATEAQVLAARPHASTWLAANAGSGKTRVLTDRVARLLLEGVEPQRILCLTYTKAAASEMQNRLFKRLGKWAMLENAALRAELRELGLDGEISPEALRQARTLFARAIETPGGLKIQTIHSFCASLLRRFPLEAKVSPGFAEMEDRAAALLRAEIVQDMADGSDASAVRAMADFLSDSDFEQITSRIVGNRSAFANGASRAQINAVLGIAPDARREDAIGMTFDGSEKWISGQVKEAFKDASKTYVEFASALNALDFESPGFGELETLFDLFLFKSGDKAGMSKSSNFPQSNHKKAVEAMAPIAEELHDWMDRVEAARNHLLAMEIADQTEVLHQFAAAFLPRYEARKQALGWLDFDDLIHKARDLLTDPGVAAWVLYRLDGGIDHILVDEAQDTSPTQWQVIELLAQEFTSGAGARSDVARTIFVVGDKKQSIYSFQGADPREFDRMQAEFQTRLQATERPLVSSVLEYSFRSSEAILRLVDETFAGRADSGFPTQNRHRAFKSEMPGRVDLWPVVEKVQDADEGAWFDPVDLLSEDHHSKQMARRVADQIKEMIDAGTPLPEEEGNSGTYRMRAVQPGDFLILVQRRSALFAEIIRACKERGLPIAGADRLKVGAELAVRDLGALMSFLAVPEDSLSLAVALKSPLFGWDEQALFDLAHRRTEMHLWQALRNRGAEYPQTLAVLRDLLNNTDFLRPFDLIERILTRHDGRRKLLARLGPEAEDGVNAFLAQALSYERTAIPSLSGFLQWMETDALEIKRQMDSAGNRIRVMTVHGAKGLEAPIVILPDTGTRPVNTRMPFLMMDGVPVAYANKSGMTPNMLAARQDYVDAQQAERDRLLYVAMTRAEKWLIVGAAGELDGKGECWYEKIAEGMSHCGAVDADFSFGRGQRLQSGDWTAPIVEHTPQTSQSAVALPEIYQRPAAAPERRMQTLSPSDLGGAKALPGEAGQDEEAAKRHGRRIHLLLEHLPNYPQSEWPKVSEKPLGVGQDRTMDGTEAHLLAEASAVLLNPENAALFQPETLAEVSVTAELGDGRRLHGTIDRLIVQRDKVIAVDFKSNAVVPDQPGQVPSGLLRQMAAYAVALRSIYPGRTVETALLWTRTGQLMHLPDPLLETALAEVLAETSEQIIP